MLSRRNKWILSLAFCPLLSSSLSASSNLTDFKKSYPPICMVHDWDNHMSPATAIPQAVKPAAQTIPWSEWLNRGAAVLDRTIESSKQMIQQIYDQIPKSETLPLEESDLLCGDSNRDWCEPFGSQDVACFPISSGCCPIQRESSRDLAFVDMPEMGCPPSTNIDQAAFDNVPVGGFPECIVPKFDLLSEVIRDEYKPYDMNHMAKTWFDKSGSRSIPLVMREPGMIDEPMADATYETPFDAIDRTNRDLQALAEMDESMGAMDDLYRSQVDRSEQQSERETMESRPEAYAEIARTYDEESFAEYDAFPSQREMHYQPKLVSLESASPTGMMQGFTESMAASCSSFLRMMASQLHSIADKIEQSITNSSYGSDSECIR